MLTNKRIGGWNWALSGEEGMIALVVGRALREGTTVSATLKRRYDAMLKKQKKLQTAGARVGERRGGAEARPRDAGFRSFS
jgi:hypothetical protein